MVDNQVGSGSSPEDIGWIFVPQYYTFLHKAPHRLHCFYTKDSTLIFGREGEEVTPRYGQTEIHDRIMSLGFQDCKVYVENVDSLPSAAGCIIIQVLGEMSNKGMPWRKFAQTFLLAPQPSGFFLMNDIFRFLKDSDDDEESAYAEFDADVATPVDLGEPVSPPPPHPAAAAAAPAGSLANGDNTGVVMPSRQPQYPPAHPHPQQQQQPVAPAAPAVPQYAAQPNGILVNGIHSEADAHAPPPVSQQTRPQPKSEPAPEPPKAETPVEALLAEPAALAASAQAPAQEEAKPAPQPVEPPRQPSPAPKEPAAPAAAEPPKAPVVEPTPPAKPAAPAETEKPSPPASTPAKAAPAPEATSSQPQPLQPPQASTSTAAPAPENPPPKRAPTSWASLAAVAPKQANKTVTDARGVVLAAPPQALSSGKPPSAPATAAASSPAPSAPASVSGYPTHANNSGKGHPYPRIDPDKLTVPNCFVRNIPQGIDKRALEAEIKRAFGPVREFTLAADKGAAWLEFATVDSARRAVKASLPPVAGGSGGLPVTVDGRTSLIRFEGKRNQNEKRAAALVRDRRQQQQQQPPPFERTSLAGGAPNVPASTSASSAAGDFEQGPQGAPRPAYVNGTGNGGVKGR